MNESPSTNLIRNNIFPETDNDISINLPNNLEPEILIENEESKGGRKLMGRKRKDSLNKGKHDKYYSDNLIRKIKSKLLHFLYIFINATINEIYKNEPDYDKEKDILMKINQGQIVKSNIAFNQKFLKETLEHIFSVDISTKYKYFKSTHNKDLIIELMNDNNPERRQIFQNLFSKTFLECLEHFGGTKNIIELEGLTTFDKYRKKSKEDIDYLDSLEHTIKNYEEIILYKKKGRERRI